MCGIAVALDSDRDRCCSLVRSMTAAQAHRGPDGDGHVVLEFGGGWAGLGHRRLSILDLTASASQPMTTPDDQGAWLTYNGELYNYAAVRGELAALGHTFRSTGDTEVLLRALEQWGPAALPKLHGMYAFAYYHPGRRRLLVARDPAGIKPLYFARSGSRWAFASEVRPLLAAGFVRPTLDPAGVAGYLAYGAVQHPLTLFAGVRSFPPGSYQEFEPHDGGGRPVGPPVAFWTYPTPLPPPAVRAEEAVERVRAAVDSAVKDHLVSDVPVGVFLSSGLDSTVVAGLAGRHAPDVRTYTVTLAEDRDLDESAAAAETARLFGLTHTVVPLTAADAEHTAADWLAALDQPSLDGLNVFAISQAVRRQGVKVCLSGQGGDELFGGYPSFTDVPRVRRIARGLRWMPGEVRRALAAAAARTRPASARAKLGDMLAGRADLASLTLARRRLMSDEQIRGLGFRPAELGLDTRYLSPEAAPRSDADSQDAVVVVSRVESTYYQGNTLLRDGDANGMAHGLEIRLPLLGQQVLDLVHALPGAVRLPAGAAPKHLLRKAFPELLRPDLLSRPKTGFTLPIRRWMRTSLRPRCEAALAALKQVRPFTPAGVDAVYAAFLAAPESPAWTRAFALCVLGDFISRTGAVAA